MRKIRRQGSASFKALAFAALVGAALAVLLMRNFEWNDAREAVVLDGPGDKVGTTLVADAPVLPAPVVELDERVDEALVDSVMPIEESPEVEVPAAHQAIFERTGRTAKECLDALVRMHDQFERESDPDDEFEYRGDEPEHGYFLSTAAVESIMLVQGRAQFEPDPGETGFKLRLGDPDSHSFMASNALYRFPSGEFPIYDAISDRMRKAKLEGESVPPLTAEQLAEVEALYAAAHQALSVYQ